MVCHILDLGYQRTAVDFLILELIYECYRERKAVEAHSIEHAQILLLLGVVLFVGIEVHSIQL